MSIVTFINFSIQALAINICVCVLFLKIVNSKRNNIIIIGISTLIISVMYVMLKYLEINFVIILIIGVLMYSAILAITTKNLINYSIIIVIVSYAITFISNIISGIIVYYSIRNLRYEENIILNLIVIYFIQILLVIIFSRIKRLSNGFSFLNNSSKSEIVNATIFFISAEILLYLMIVRKPVSEITSNDIMSFFIVTSIFMIILIFMSFRSYYKSLQTQKIINKLNVENKEKDDEYNKLYADYKRVTDKMHATSHKVKSVYNYIANMNVEFGEELIEEIGELKKQLNKDNAIDKNNLPATNIFSIDSMFKYMRSETIRNNIGFELNVNGDVNCMINNIVDKEELEIMIADHIKDAIIAIKSSDNQKNRKILVQLGKFKDCYELSVNDTGIEFEINTLINLGLKRITTHEETGGTGIGFMSTFEVLKKHNASLEVKEFTPKEDMPYTKSISIVFDGKNEYRIFSHRKEEIRLADKNNRIVIEKDVK